MNKKYEIFGNNIELLFLSPNKGEGDINEDFNYHTKIFTVTRGVQKLKINKELCWIIDNGEDICLLLPSEY